MEAVGMAKVVDPEDIVLIELEFTTDELYQLFNQLPNHHPLVAKLKRQLNSVYENHTEGKTHISSMSHSLMYLAEKLKVSSMEQLFSKALTFINWGMELEEKGYKVQAVKSSFFTKEVIKFRIGGN